MKKKYILFVILFISLLLVSCNFVNDNIITTTNNTITVDYDNYIEIVTLEDLLSIENNKSYKLMDNINISGIDWQPIGSYTDPFLGNFDGNGFTISNLKINNDNIYNGLFGYVLGNITNLILEDIDVNYSAEFTTYFGGIAGYSSGNIENSFVSGNVVISEADSNVYAGMLVGMTEGKVETINSKLTIIPNLINNNEVEGELIINANKLAFIGGLIGKAFDSKIANNLVVLDIYVTALEYTINIGGMIGNAFGGIPLEQEDIFLDNNTNITSNISKTTININTLNGNISVGGFIGYGHSEYTKDNFIESNIQIDGNTLIDNIINIGGYFGEVWNSSLENIVLSVSYNLSLNDEIEYNIGAIYGVKYMEYESFNSYLINGSNFNNQGCILTNLDTILDSTYALEHLGWTQLFLNKIE